MPTPAAIAAALPLTIRLGLEKPGYDPEFMPAWTWRGWLVSVGIPFALSAVLAQRLCSADPRCHENPTCPTTQHSSPPSPAS